MNQMKAHLAALSLLDRAVHALSDDELRAILDALEPDAADAIAQAIGLDDVNDADAVTATRAAAVKGRVNGVLSQLGVVLSDACLADCIRALGDSADNPTEEELRAASHQLVADHGVGAVRLMLASAVVGEAPASVACIHLLKHDEVLALPAIEPRPRIVAAPADPALEAERDAVRERRKAEKARKQTEARARREQAERARRKA